MRQSPHQLVEEMIGQSPEREIMYNCLYNSRVSLRETLSRCLKVKLALDVLPQKTQQFCLLQSNISHNSSHFAKRECQNHRGHMITPWGGGNAG